MALLTRDQRMAWLDGLLPGAGNPPPAAGEDVPGKRHAGYSPEPMLAV